MGFQRIWNSDLSKLMCTKFCSFILLFFFHICEVALPSRICFSIMLVFHQHFDSHVAYPGNPPNLQTTQEGNFCTCHRTLFSDYAGQSLTTRSPERGFSTSITLALYLAQPHCASITKHGQWTPYMTSH